MTVSIRHRTLRTAAQLLTAGLVIGGYLTVAHGIADAHDFSLAVGKPACVNGRKVVDVTVTNPWDDSAKVFTAEMSGGFAPIAAHGTFPIHESTVGATVGLGPSTIVRLIWDADGFTKDHSYQINWGSSTCEGVPATTTTTTIPLCPPGQYHSTAPPAGCYPEVTTVPTEPPATSPPEATTVPPAAATTPTPTTESAPPVSVTVKKAAATTVPHALPVTGGSDTTILAAGLAALAIAAICLYMARRPSQS